MLNGESVDKMVNLCLHIPRQYMPLSRKEYKQRLSIAHFASMNLKKDINRYDHKSEAIIENFLNRTLS